MIKVNKKVKGGKILEVIFYNRVYEIPLDAEDYDDLFFACARLTKALTGAYPGWGQLGLLEGSEGKFHIVGASKEFEFEPVRDWWELSEEEIAQVLKKRAVEVNKWVAEEIHRLEED